MWTREVWVPISISWVLSTFLNTRINRIETIAIEVHMEWSILLSVIWQQLPDTYIWRSQSAHHYCLLPRSLFWHTINLQADILQQRCFLDKTLEHSSCIYFSFLAWCCFELQSQVHCDKKLFIRKQEKTKRRHWWYKHHNTSSQTCVPWISFYHQLDFSQPTIITQETNKWRPAIHHINTLHSLQANFDGNHYQWFSPHCQHRRQRRVNQCCW